MHSQDNHPTQTQRIRVALVSEPGIAGVKTHVMDILQNIDVSRFDVRYYYSLVRSDSTYVTEIEALRARGITCEEIAIDEELHPMRDLVSFIRLSAALRKFHPQVLHLHSSKASGLGRFAARLLSPKPVVLYTPNAMGCYRSRLYLMLERMLGKLTDVLVAVSASEKRDFIQWEIPGANDAFVLTVGVRSVEVPTPKAHPGEWVVGACGRICYQKNALLFFRTAIAMVAKDPTLRFRWIGEFATDAEAEEVRKLLLSANHPPQIVVTGWVSEPHRAMAELDTFCMFSRYESFGYVTAEAMLLNVPVVALSTTGTMDLVLHEQTGLITTSEVDVVAENLLRIRNDSELRERLKAQAKERIQRVYTVQEMVNQMSQLYVDSAAKVAT